MLLALTAQATRIIGGQGNFQYEYVPEKLALPSSVHMKNGHGLARDHQGNIYFTYESDSVDADTRALIRFDPDGTGAEVLGTDNTLAQGTPHGLRISYEADGVYLYHSNNQATVHKTTLDGRILWSRNESSLWSNTSFWPFRPTDAVVPPAGARNRDLFVTDGYGQAFIHELTTARGAYTNSSFGGAGSSLSPPRFNCPHGINYDPRRGLLVVADRANHRFMYLNFDGTFNSSVPMPDSVSLPCNIDFGFDASHALVPNLGSYTDLGKAANGTVAVLDESNRVVSVVEIAKLLGDQGHQHPHDAIFLANGDIVVCCWYPGRISYWRRLSAEESATRTAEAANHPEQ